MAQVVMSPEVTRVMSRKMRAQVEGMGDDEFKCLACGETDRVSDQGRVTVIVYMDDVSAYVRFAHEFCAPSQVIRVPGRSQPNRPEQGELTDAGFFVRAQAKPRPLLLFSHPSSPGEEAGVVRQLLELGFQRLLAPVHLCVPAPVEGMAVTLTRDRLQVRLESLAEPLFQQELATISPGFLASLGADRECVLITGPIRLAGIQSWPDDVQPFLEKALAEELLVGATAPIREHRSGPLRRRLRV
jgi:hypothetical protein